MTNEREARELLAQIEGGEHGQRIRLGTYGMSYVRTDKAMRAIIAALTSEQREVFAADYVLPCDVAVAPATKVTKGCTLKTLMQSITLREAGEMQEHFTPGPEFRKLFGKEAGYQDANPDASVGPAFNAQDGDAGRSCAASPQQEAPGAVASVEDAGEFHSDTAALAFLRVIGGGNPNVEYAVERLRLSLITPPAPVDVRKLLSVVARMESYATDQENDPILIPPSRIRSWASDIRALLDGPPAGVGR